MKKINLLVILGPTASGKTKLAVEIAKRINGEIISGDSRQVYKKMDIGTGKDLEEYGDIPYHLINIVEPGTKYNIKDFKEDFNKVFLDIQSRGKFPILCGGSGLYLQSALRPLDYSYVPTNNELRSKLIQKSEDELRSDFNKIGADLKKYFDSSSLKRIQRAIEISEYLKENEIEKIDQPQINPLILGVDISREERRKKIEIRLDQRLEKGMIEEVKELRASGISDEDLIYYGLEYKWITLYLKGEIDKKTMKERLLVAIQQFSKRQMTFFRSMEKKGIEIEWGKKNDLLDISLKSLGK